MNIKVHRLSEDYICTGNTNAEIDLETTFNTIIENELLDSILEIFPEYKNRNISVKVEWIYEGYRVFIYGVKFLDDEVEKLLTTIAPLTLLDYCDLFWDIDKTRKQYTGILLAYDYKNFHKISVNNSSFIALTHGGISQFLERTNIKYSNSDIPELKAFADIDFSYIHKDELEITKERLKKSLSEPKKNFSDSDMVKTKIIGKIRRKQANIHHYSRL